MSREMLADTETPVSAFMKLCLHQKDSFLLESGEGDQNSGRFSVIAFAPLAVLDLNWQTSKLSLKGKEIIKKPEEFFNLAQKASQMLQCQDLPELPGVGSFMGCISYEAVGLIEKIKPVTEHELPLARLCFASLFAVFDHLRRKITLVSLAEDKTSAEAGLDKMDACLNHSLPALPRPQSENQINRPCRKDFVNAVKQAKQEIMAGEIFQVVLSAPFTVQTKTDPFQVYRWLRVKNPSPYMFFLNLPGFQLAGASPETLIKIQDGKVILRPIAGTRPRSRDLAKDHDLEQELLASEKEKAEHVMLVDLARNDAGRLSTYGSISVQPYMQVERFSHVMHLTSQVNGRLDPRHTVWDAFKAAFPAGTVSGAPKVRAMEIIGELETSARGPYAGAVGFFGPENRMDTCIAIRMLQFEKGKITLQAGAGIVADSDPEMEYQEINHKAAQGLAALRAAAEGRL
jgi:anthranilate synthase component 1